mmetsp:Transcript_35418/g.56624  ORF Transcript_35418/g.56624 Transcript_35418/m.56624 type:complete len:652 (-) Transcript_35418:254-2209(-)
MERPSSPTPEEQELVKNATTCMVNVVLAARCPNKSERRSSETSNSHGDSSKALFGLRVGYCRHRIETIGDGPGSIVVDTSVKYRGEWIVLERWTIITEGGSSSMGSVSKQFADTASQHSTGSSQSKGSSTSNVRGRMRKGNNPAQAFRKASVLVRSIHSLCMFLPSNSLMYAAEKGQGEKLEFTHTVFSTGDTVSPAHLHTLNRTVFELKPLHTQTSRISISVNYVKDISEIVQSVSPKVVSGIGRLLQKQETKTVRIRTETLDGEGYETVDTGNTDTEDELVQSRPLSATHATSGPLDIPMKRTSKHAYAQRRKMLGRTPPSFEVDPLLVHSLPIQKGAYSTSLGKTRAKPVSSSPFKFNPSTPPLHPPGAMMRTDRQPSTGDLPFVFHEDGSLERGHPHSLPARFVTLPSGTTYNSGNSLSSMGASLASSVQLFYGGKSLTDGELPFAGSDSCSRTLLSSASSSASAKHGNYLLSQGTPSSSPTFGALAAALAANPTIQHPCNEPETLFAFEDSSNRPGAGIRPSSAKDFDVSVLANSSLQPFKSRGQSKTGDQLFGSDQHEVTGDLLFDMDRAWFVPEEEVDEYARNFFVAVGITEDSTYSSFGSNLPFALESNEEPGMDLKNVHMFLKVCEMTPAALGLDRLGLNHT